MTSYSLVSFIIPRLTVIVIPIGKVMRESHALLGLKKKLFLIRLMDEVERLRFIMRCFKLDIYYDPCKGYTCFPGGFFLFFYFFI